MIFQRRGNIFPGVIRIFFNRDMGATAMGYEVANATPMCDNAGGSLAKITSNNMKNYLINNQLNQQPAEE